MLTHYNSQSSSGQEENKNIFALAEKARRGLGKIGARDGVEWAGKGRGVDVDTPQRPSRKLVRGRRPSALHLAFTISAHHAFF